MSNFKTNKFGRSYISGRPLSDDFRVVILDTIIVNRGDGLTDYNQITYSEINDDNNLTTAGKSVEDIQNILMFI